MDKLFHPAAKEGFSRSSDLYERARSGYPERVAQRLFKYLNLKSGQNVLELGAGTGKWTERLLQVGSVVTAVEPSAQMRDKLAEKLPTAKVLDATAEALPLASGSVDLVFSATAFHWFEPFEAYREISRVLKPGGGLGLLWTTWHEQKPNWYSDIRRLMTPFEVDVPRYHHMKWREPFDSEIDFKFLQFERHDTARPMTKLEICERMLSVSYIAALPDLLYSGLRHEMEAILDHHILKGQIFRMPEEIHIYWTHKEN